MILHGMEQIRVQYCEKGREKVVYVISVKVSRNYTEWSGHCIYVSVVRLALKYAYPVWHSNLPNIFLTISKSYKKGNNVFSGLSYAETLRYANLDIQKGWGGCLCQTSFDKIKVGTHRLHNLLRNQRITKYGIGEANADPLAVTRTNRCRNSCYTMGITQLPVFRRGQNKVETTRYHMSIYWYNMLWCV